MTLRVVQYYPRAVSGDGGMTGAVHRLTRSLDRAGAQAAIVFDPGRSKRDAPEGIDCIGVSHVGTANQRLPRTKALRDVWQARSGGGAKAPAGGTTAGTNQPAPPSGQDGSGGGSNGSGGTGGGNSGGGNNNGGPPGDVIH